MCQVSEPQFEPGHALQPDKPGLLFGSLGFRIRDVFVDPVTLLFSVLDLLWLYVKNGDTPMFISVLFHISGSTGTLSLVGSRMLIQLKQVAEQNPREGGSLRLPTHASTDVFRTISTGHESIPGHSQPANLKDQAQWSSEHEN
ncbi:hypothetical protein A7U60_g6867 [Sanghuangporus baumii]|uniref:Uncharacterized protein n=1 Tax=Sanghuangporus baumii TaxID=108892 RepID=A0A9Q5HU03_SANBA|nr:hypothetical protein A7U60_g6867 [Sanghuangporus baumii]